MLAFNDWKLNEGFKTSMIYDYDLLHILGSIWKSEAYKWETIIKKRRTSPLAGIVKIKNESYEVIVEDLQTAGNFSGDSIVLSSNYPKEKRTTSIIYHELVHAGWDQIDPTRAWGFDNISKKKDPRALDKVISAFAGGRQNLDNLKAYYLSKNEFSSYVGQLYQAVVFLSMNEDLSEKCLNLLRKGDTSSIFQLMDPERAERIIHQIYFGGNDPVGIDYIEQKNLEKKGLINTLPEKEANRIIAEFKQSLLNIFKM